MEQTRSNKKAGPWCWQEKKAMEIIRNNFVGKKRTTCIAIYQSLTEIASNRGSDIFPAYLSNIAKYSGKTISTVKRYCKELVKLKLLSIENRKLEERINLPNRWTLLTPSIQDNEPTSTHNKLPKSIQDNGPHIKENVLEENIFKSEGYKKAMETRNKIGLGDCIVNKSQLK